MVTCIRVHYILGHLSYKHVMLFMRFSYIFRWGLILAYDICNKALISMHVGQFNFQLVTVLTVKARVISYNLDKMLALLIRPKTKQQRTWFSDVTYWHTFSAYIFVYMYNIHANALQLTRFALCWKKPFMNIFIGLFDFLFLAVYMNIYYILVNRFPENF